MALDGQLQFDADTLKIFMGGTFRLPMIVNVEQLVGVLADVLVELRTWSGDPEERRKMSIAEMHMADNKISIVLDEGIPDC